jgi:hypothetical protein
LRDSFFWRSFCRSCETTREERRGEERGIILWRLEGVFFSFLFSLRKKEVGDKRQLRRLKRFFFGSFGVGGSFSRNSSRNSVFGRSGLLGF